MFHMEFASDKTAWVVIGKTLSQGLVIVSR